MLKKYTCSEMYVLWMGKKIDICEIANKFNTLFTHIGPNQSKNINYTGDKTYKK